MTRSNVSLRPVTFMHAYHDLHIINIMISVTLISKQFLIILSYSVVLTFILLLQFGI